ncbi:MAG: CPBP family intramembrane glutamic endopeptidase [Gemmatimonadales bacterium]
MPRPRQLWLYFVLTFAVSWIPVSLPLLFPDFSRRVLGEFTLQNPVVFLAVYTPSLVGIVLTGIFEGPAGLKRFFGRLSPFRVRWPWFVVALAGIPLLVALGALVTGGSPAFAGWGAVAAVPTALVLDPGPIGEEFGWRGYALPRLLDRWSPFTATLILGVIWAIWHVPAFYLPGMPQSELNLATFFAGAIGVSMFMTWTQLGTAGSILIAILIHLMTNHSEGLTGGDFDATTAGYALAAVAILWFRRKTFFAAPGSDGGPLR